MDFSEFGPPSQEWLTFIATNPLAAQDGFTENDPGQAADLRASTNKARGAVGAKLLATTGLDQRVTISTFHVPCKDNRSIPLRIYKPREPRDSSLNGTLLYFHGGGFLLGDETSDDFLCCRIAEESNICVVNVIYRHTHKFKHPAQVDDAWNAFEYIRDNADTVDQSISKGLIVMGISAGCTLAAGVVLRDRELVREEFDYQSKITGMVLSIPWLIHIDNYPFHLFKSQEVSAKIQNRETPVIPSDRIKLFSDLLGADDPKERLLNIPLLPDDQLQGWPKTAFLVAGADPLRDDGLIFARRLGRLGLVLLHSRLSRGTQLTLFVL